MFANSSNLELNNTSTVSNVVRDQVADFAVAILYIVLSLVLLATYFPTLYVLLRDESTMRKSCYKIMVSMGVADIIQVIGIGLVGGIFTLQNSTGSDTTNRVFGSAINMCWLANCFQGNMLAFNRFLSIWFPQLCKQLFYNWKTFIWIAVGYIYGLSINAMYVAYNADLIYKLDGYIWYYNITSINRFCFITEISQDYINEGMSLIFCILIAIKIKIMRASTTANKLSNADKAAIYQAVWICCSLMFYNAVYFCVANVTTNKWAIFLGNLLWIWVNGQTPTVFVVFNKRLRQDLLKLFGFKVGTVGPPVGRLEIHMLDKLPCERLTTD